MAVKTLGYIDELEVISDSSLPKTYMVPSGKHVPFKRWMINRAYYFRIMKKWAKKHGGEKHVLVWADETSVVANPEVAQGILFAEQLRSLRESK